MTNKDNVSRETIENNFDILLENAINSYEKILDLMKILEGELKKKGLNYKVSFEIEERLLIFRFEHKGKIEFTRGIRYDKFKKFSNDILGGFLILEFLRSFYVKYGLIEN